ncbi:MAG: dockerin type I domain-containing protein, partial [Planctomycetota bacterium]
KLLTSTGTTLSSLASAPALFVGGSTVAKVMGNVFVGNTSTNNAGAIAIEDNVVPLLVSNFFIDNTGANGSGALDISNQGGGEGSSNFTGPQPQGIVSDCVFDSNQEGCVRIEGNGPRFVNCVFRNNTSAAAGGAMLIIPNSSVQLFNCVFDGNQSDDFGGAILNFDASLEMINCTMVHNTAELGGDSFAATADANTSVVNSIIWDNGSPMGITEGGDGSFSLEFSIVEGGFPGTGNIDQDPQFVDEFGPDGLAGTGDEDLSLQSTSPAIDAGDNLAVLLDDFDADEDEDFTERFPFDLLLNARFVDHPEVADTGNGLSPIVDMGAIEFQVATKVLLGDVNLDGVVDLLDVESFVDRITNGVFQAEADVNQDGMVNLLDVGPFISILSNA